MKSHLLLLTIFSLASLSAFAEASLTKKEALLKSLGIAYIEAGDSPLVQAIKLAKIKIGQKKYKALKRLVCEQQAFESKILENLKEALRLDPEVKSQIMADQDLNQVLGHNLSFQEMLGKLGPGLEGIHSLLAQAHFDSLSHSYPGPARRIHFKPNGKMRERLYDAHEGVFNYQQGTYKLLLVNSDYALVKINFTKYKLTKTKDQYVLMSAEDEKSKKMKTSLFNTTQGECDSILPR